MATKRRSGHEAKLTPTYEDEVPVANKITINPRTKHEVTILLREPRGREARKLTARLLPFLEHLGQFVSSDGDVSVTEQDFDVFVRIVSKLWGEDSFEDELLPGVLGLNPEDKKDYEILESMTLIGAFGAFITAFMYMMSDADDEEFQQAQKKSSGGGEGEEEQPSPKKETTA